MPLDATPRVVRTVTIFTLSYLAVSSMVAYRIENWEFFIYVFVVLVTGLVVLYIHRFVPASPAVFWMLSFWGFLHMFGGLVVLPDWMRVENERHVLYDLWIIYPYFKYDMIVHGLGFVGGTWACWEIIAPIIHTRRVRLVSVLIAILMANGLGVLNELIEFIAYLTLPITGVGGYVNTGWDLVCNLIGSLVGGSVAWKWGRSPTIRAQGPV